MDGGSDEHLHEKVTASRLSQAPFVLNVPLIKSVAHLAG